MIRMESEEAHAAVELFGLFLAAVHAVAPGLTSFPEDPGSPAEGLDLRSGGQLWNWATRSSIGHTLSSLLTVEQRTRARELLDAMLRERMSMTFRAEATLKPT